MFYQLHRSVRSTIAREISLFLDDHPYFKTTITQGKFQQAPVVVADKYNFNGRQFPAVIINTTSSKEQRLSMDRLIDERIGYVRAGQMTSFLAMKVYDDPEYTGTRVNSVSLLYLANTNKVDDEEIRLAKVSVSAVDGVPATGAHIEWFDVQPDGRYKNIIEGAEVIMGSFNDMRQGVKLYVETFADKQYLGDVFGSRFDMDIGIDIYAQSQYETEELVDLVNSAFLYIIPQRVYNGMGWNLKTVSTDGVIEKDGKVGEEHFKGTLSVDASVEHQFFVPNQTVTSYALFIEMREQVDGKAGEIIIEEKAQ